MMIATCKSTQQTICTELQIAVNKNKTPILDNKNKTPILDKKNQGIIDSTRTETRQIFSCMFIMGKD